MERLERPLNPRVLKDADDQLYAKHAEDKWPNAFFDVQGHRRPLDPSDPAQSKAREEWVVLYKDEHRKITGTTGTTPTVTAGTNIKRSSRPVGHTTEPCPRTHYIRIRLVRFADKKTRYQYWPPRPNEAYGGEPFGSDLTDACVEGSLGGDGVKQYDNIPAGTCSFQFHRFLDEISEYLESEIAKPWS